MLNVECSQFPLSAFPILAFSLQPSAFFMVPLSAALPGKYFVPLVPFCGCCFAEIWLNLES
jgi:hypothetical protein